MLHSKVWINNKNVKKIWIYAHKKRTQTKRKILRTHYSHHDDDDNEQQTILFSSYYIWWFHRKSIFIWALIKRKSSQPTEWKLAHDMMRMLVYGSLVNLQYKALCVCATFPLFRLCCSSVSFSSLFSYPILLFVFHCIRYSSNEMNGQNDKIAKNSNKPKLPYEFCRNERKNNKNCSLRLLGASPVCFHNTKTKPIEWRRGCPCRCRNHHNNNKSRKIVTWNNNWQMLSLTSQQLCSNWISRLGSFWKPKLNENYWNRGLNHHQTISLASMLDIDGNSIDLDGFWPKG